MTPRRAAALRSALDALLTDRSDADRLASDPLGRVRRYEAPADQEIAAIFASGLAYGRVTMFLPVLDRLFAAADAAGGPRAWIEGFNANSAEAVLPLQHRWTKGLDLALLALALQGVLRQKARIGELFEDAYDPAHPDLAPALAAGIAALRGAALAGAPILGVKAASFEDLPRGLRNLLASPADGSACKRWNMLLRWMVRPDPPDLGLWALPPAKLTLPLDTHTHSLARMMGLTDRGDGSWRTAAAITAALARLDPSDPVKYDFALSHLGISGGCQKRRVPAVCDECALALVCAVGGRPA